MNVLDALRQVTTSIKSWTDENKVQKINGKGLSTNDYTTADKNKVAGIPNDLVVLDGKLFLAKDGVIINDSAVNLPSGGGGGLGCTSSGDPRYGANGKGYQGVLYLRLPLIN